ncbi:hypothetical protein GCM10010505_10190 [Kitasatospora aburaviensis]
MRRRERFGAAGASAGASAEAFMSRASGVSGMVVLRASETAGAGWPGGGERRVWSAENSRSGTVARAPGAG